MTCSSLVEDISIEWRILIRGILKKKVVRMCSGLMWDMIRFCDGPL